MFSPGVLVHPVVLQVILRHPVHTHQVNLQPCQALELADPFAVGDLALEMRPSGEQLLVPRIIGERHEGAVPALRSGGSVTCQELRSRLEPSWEQSVRICVSVHVSVSVYVSMLANECTPVSLSVAVDVPAPVSLYAPVPVPVSVHVPVPVSRSLPPLPPKP